MYLYIRDKIILGVLVAEHINTAHRMIPELLELDCCTAESTPAKCGINIVWTDIKHRKQGIASKLVDILRYTFIIIKHVLTLYTVLLINMFSIFLELNFIMVI